MDSRLNTDSNSPPQSPFRQSGPLRQSSPHEQKSTTRFYRTEYVKEKLSSGVIKANLKNTSADGMVESKSSCLRLPERKHKQYTSLISPSSSVSSISGNVINTRKYIREVYGPFLCSLLFASAFMVIVGGALTLSGFYVPVLPLEHLGTDVVNLENKKHPTLVDVSAFRKAQIHNNTLTGLRISGVVLLVIGLIGIIILLLTPIVCLRRTEYALLPPDETTRPHSSFSSASGLPDDMFTFSVVKQHIQPKKQAAASGKAGRGLRSSSAKQRAHYDKGFLSPEMNRGPIFVSDRSCNLHQNVDGKDSRKHRKPRASSFDSRLAATRYSPQLSVTSEHHHRRSPRYSIPGQLTPDYPLASLGPIKAGSFHSLR
jgi:hypothetical protein